jgi:S1-C subfamily serine protease
VRPFVIVAAGLLVTAIVAAAVTLAVLQLQSRTNPQQVNLRSGVTIAEDSAIVQAAAKAMPAVVSVVTQEQPSLVRGSGYLATSDGYIVTSVGVVTGATALTVLVTGDTIAHAARLVDYDCQSGVAVLKIDKVNGLPTLAFADPTALVLGQRIVALAGPLEGSAVTPAYVSAMHRSTSFSSPASAGGVDGFADAIRISSVIGVGTAGGPLLNVAGQVVGIALQSPSGADGGYGLNVADVQDDVQQILQTGQVVVASMGATATEISAAASALDRTPEGGRLTSVDPTGPAGTIGLLPGDIVTQVDDVKLDAAHPLGLLLRSRFHPSQRVTVTYSRGTASTQVELTLTGSHPSCA